jgi:hypothetical protein
LLTISRSSSRARFTENVGSTQRAAEIGDSAGAMGQLVLADVRFVDVLKSAKAVMANVVILRCNKDQDESEKHGGAERGLLSVPSLRLPHLEPFTADD